MEQTAELARQCGEGKRHLPGTVGNHPGYREKGSHDRLQTKIIHTYDQNQGHCHDAEGSSEKEKLQKAQGAVLFFIKKVVEAKENKEDGHYQSGNNVSIEDDAEKDACQHKLPVQLLFRLPFRLFDQAHKAVEGNGQRAQHGVAVQGKAAVHNEIGKDAQHYQAGIKALCTPLFPDQQGAEDNGQNAHDGSGQAQCVEVKPEELNQQGAEIRIKGTLLAIKIGWAYGHEISVAVGGVIGDGPGIQSQPGLVYVHSKGGSAKMKNP